MKYQYNYLILRYFKFLLVIQIILEKLYFYKLVFILKSINLIEGLTFGLSKTIFKNKFHAKKYTQKEVNYKDKELFLMKIRDQEMSYRLFIEESECIKDIYLNQCKRNKKIFSFDSYTLSYIIENNLIVIAEYFLEPNNKYKSYLRELFYVIILKNEFRGNLSNNHILRSSLSLYLIAPIVFDNNYSKKLFKNLVSHFNLVFENDGSSKENSTHYQLIFYFWFLKSYYIINKLNDLYKRDIFKVEEINWFKSKIKKLKFWSDIFSSPNNFDLIHLQGDICPDLNPCKTLKLIRFFEEFLKNTYFKELKSKNNNLKGSCKSWSYLSRKNLFLLYKNFEDTSPLNNYKSHMHMDYGNFTFSDEKGIIINDAGMYSYEKALISDWQFSENGHNIPLFNNKHLTLINDKKFGRLILNTSKKNSLEVKNNQLNNKVNINNFFIRHYTRFFYLHDEYLEVIDKFRIRNPIKIELNFLICNDAIVCSRAYSGLKSNLQNQTKLKNKEFEELKYDTVPVKISTEYSNKVNSFQKKLSYFSKEDFIIKTFIRRDNV